MVRLSDCHGNRLGKYLVLALSRSSRSSTIVHPYKSQCNIVKRLAICQILLTFQNVDTEEPRHQAFYFKCADLFLAGVCSDLFT